MRLFITLTAIILLMLPSMGQTSPVSRLYDYNGRLFADSTLCISLLQLSKWTAIEDTLTMKILKKLDYPLVLSENGLTGRVIISFVIDTGGRFCNYGIERFNTRSLIDTNGFVIKDFMKSSFKATRHFSGAFAKDGFKSEKGIIERYYLPFDFELNYNDIFLFIKNGWLTLDKRVYKNVY